MLQNILRVAGAAFIVYITILARPGSSLFSFHPVLMTLSFTGAMTEAIFIFTKYGLASGSLRSTRVTAHWIVIGIAALCHFIGYAVIYYNKEINNKPHNTSWHGFLGLIASVLFWIQLSVGIFAKYPQLLKNVMPLKRLRASHALFGMLIFISGMGAMILALWSTWFVSNASPAAFYGAMGLYITLALTAVIVFTKKYAQLLF
ncbi:transmembrane reductase CYB561D2 [Macrobrachium rosenbergii]|uniref:transmembrane reductase CYB561D2 n=1 Tax=Macrobrachium rosenbergii TaxID=79674 RepID=UPI0034D476BE